jgi:hypothetical protein
MSRFLRYLRIAFSATCIIACALLIVLWVRSYSWADLLAYRRGQTFVAVGAGRGIACFHWHTSEPFVTVGNKLGWELLGGPAGTIDSSLKPLEWRRDRDPATVFGLFISVPYWCCVTFFATLSAVPWLPWWSNRFSLRTLLIAMTLVAVVLGLAVWAARK